MDYTANLYNVGQNLAPAGKYGTSKHVPYKLRYIDYIVYCSNKDCITASKAGVANQWVAEEIFNEYKK